MSQSNEHLTPARRRSVIDLGIMQGSPPPADKTVTWDNWMEPDNVRWSFLHMRELTPTARISRGNGPVRDLPRDDRDLTGFSFPFAGRDWTLGEMIDTTYIDGLMVVHDGRVVLEHYADGMDAATTHICQSVSKSLGATMVPILVDRGQLDPDAAVVELLPELAGTCWEGATLQHLLDMRTGTNFDETDYEDQASESWRGFRALGWMPRLPDDPDPVTYIATMTNHGPHGEGFEYRSILSAMLGWICERVSGERFADLYSREIWSRIGAEHDADFMIGPGAFPLIDGGFCVTLRDLARFGLMHLELGRVGDDQIVPESWVRRVRGPNPELAEAFKASPDSEGARPDAYYHDQWWVIDPATQTYSGYGINGQQLLIHPASQTVVARFSSWPHPWVDSYAAVADAGLLALCEHLGAAG